MMILFLSRMFFTPTFKHIFHFISYIHPTGWTLFFSIAGDKALSFITAVGLILPIFIRDNLSMKLFFPAFLSQPNWNNPAVQMRHRNWGELLDFALPQAPYWGRWVCTLNQARAVCYVGNSSQCDTRIYLDINFLRVPAVELVPTYDCPCWRTNDEFQSPKSRTDFTDKLFEKCTWLRTVQAMRQDILNIQM